MITNMFLLLLSYSLKCGVNGYMSLQEKFPFLSMDEITTMTNEFQLLKPNNIIDGKNNPLDAEYTLKVYPLHINNDEIVTVSFYSNYPKLKLDGLSHTPSMDSYHMDWIGAYSPADVDITTTVPVKYGYCDDSPTYNETGYGELKFNLTNLRADIAFYFFTNGTQYPIMVNKSDDHVVFNNINEQLRPRVVATGDPNILKLLWSSATNTKPILRWGKSSMNYDYSSIATTEQILESEMRGYPASSIGWRDLGLIHTANFTGVAALSNTKIYYIFGDEASNTWSKEYVFHCPPLAGTQPPTRPTRVILYDDFGRGTTDDTFTWYEYGRPAINTTMAVAAEIENGMVDAIYHGGDISYATGYIAVWDFFLDMLSPMAGSVVYLTTVGNHESDCPNSATYYTGNDSGGECGILTTRLLPMPAPATTDEPWWSYDVGLIHFVGMSTEHDYTIGSKQYKWIEHDLANVDRELTPWVIFGGHRAMYVNSNYGGAVTSDIVVMNLLIENIEPLLWKYKVNVAFWGHNHVVNRQTAVLNKTVIQESTMRPDEDGGIAIAWHDDPQATVHFVIGTGGAGFTKNYVEPYPDWCEEVFYRWGYTAVTAVNSTHLDWQWIDSSNSIVYDHVVITQLDPFAPFVIDTDDDSNEDSDNEKGWRSLSQTMQILIVCFVFTALLTMLILGLREANRRKREKSSMYSPLMDVKEAI